MTIIQKCLLSETRTQVLKLPIATRSPTKHIGIQNEQKVRGPSDQLLPDSSKLMANLDRDIIIGSVQCDVYAQMLLSSLSLLMHIHT